MNLLHSFKRDYVLVLCGDSMKIQTHPLRPIKEDLLKKKNILPNFASKEYYTRICSFLLRTLVDVATMIKLEISA